MRKEVKDIIKKHSEKREKRARGWLNNIGNKVKAWRKKRILKKVESRQSKIQAENEALEEERNKYDKKEEINKLLNVMKEEEKKTLEKKMKEEEKAIGEKIKANNTEVTANEKSIKTFSSEKEKAINKIRGYIQKKIETNKKTIQEFEHEETKVISNLNSAQEKLKKLEKIDEEKYPINSDIRKSYKKTKKDLEKTISKLKKIQKDLGTAKEKYERKNTNLEKKIPKDSKEKETSNKKTTSYELEKKIKILKGWNKEHPNKEKKLPNTVNVNMEIFNELISDDNELVEYIKNAENDRSEQIKEIEKAKKSLGIEDKDNDKYIDIISLIKENEKLLNNGGSTEGKKKKEIKLQENKDYISKTYKNVDVANALKIKEAIEEGENKGNNSTSSSSSENPSKPAESTNEKNTTTETKKKTKEVIEGKNSTENKAQTSHPSEKTTELPGLPKKAETEATQENPFDKTTINERIIDLVLLMDDKEEINQSIQNDKKKKVVLNPILKENEKKINEYSEEEKKKAIELKDKLETTDSSKAQFLLDKLGTEYGVDIGTLYYLIEVLEKTKEEINKYSEEEKEKARKMGEEISKIEESNNNEKREKFLDKLQENYGQKIIKLYAFMDSLKNQEKGIDEHTEKERRLANKAYRVIKKLKSDN